MLRKQIVRSAWPEFAVLDPSIYPYALRKASALQWWRRAREEYGSIHEFTAVSHALCELRAPIALLGALSRLITDEVRHAQLCATMAQHLLPEHEGLDPDLFDWARPIAPWPDAPPLDPKHPERLTAWVCDAILCSCCIGETISRPLFEAVATVTTDPVIEALVRQILLDEHLHAAFGWEALTFLLPGLPEEQRDWLQGRLSHRLAGFEASCSCGLDLADLVHEPITIEAPPPDAPPNLGMLTHKQYATIFYATLEHEVFPRFDQLGFASMDAWTNRHLQQ